MRSRRHRAGPRNNEAGQPARDDESAQRHDDTDARWLDYEIDVAKLLDFPLMTDMRDPLTIDFHKARSHADLLRPDSVEDILDDRDAQLEYRDAVHEYVAAFDVAETEAIRRRRSDFSAEAQERLERAQHLLRLASDGGATNEERKAPTHTHRRNSTDSSCCPPSRAPVSSARSPAKSRPDLLGAEVRYRARRALPACSATSCSDGASPRRFDEILARHDFQGAPVLGRRKLPGADHVDAALDQDHGGVPLLGRQQPAADHQR